MLRGLVPALSRSRPGASRDCGGGWMTPAGVMLVGCWRQLRRCGSGGHSGGSEGADGTSQECAPDGVATTTARSLRQASRAPGHVQHLDLSSSGAFVCRNMFCEKVGRSCVCRLSLWISQMSPHLNALVSVSLANNGLEHLPDSIGELCSVKRLDFRQNNIRSLPDSIGALQQLELLDLRGNPKLRADAVESLKTRLPSTTTVLL